MREVVVSTNNHYSTIVNKLISSVEIFGESVDVSQLSIQEKSSERRVIHLNNSFEMSPKKYSLANNNDCLTSKSKGHLNQIW